MKAALLPLAIALTLAGCADPEPAQKRAPGGVQAGERVVWQGVHTVTAGEKVRPVAPLHPEDFAS